MDLKIKDVAELLNVSETTIRRWIVERKIPVYRLNHQFRFSRMEIEEWVMSCKMNQKDTKPPECVTLSDEKTHRIIGKQIGTQAYSLYRAIYKGGVLHEVEGESKEEIICEAVKTIAKHLDLDADVLTDLLLDREALMPTGLNHGVAVPHTRDFLLQKQFDIVTVVFPKKEIEYGSLDGQKVHTLFFLFASGDKRHLHLLAKLAHFTREEETLEFLLQKPSKNHLLDYIKKWEANLHQTLESQVER